MRSTTDARLLQALNCLLIETPAGRVLVETGIGERLDDKTRAMRGYEGPWIAPALRRLGFLPESVGVVAMSHLHFDHAGGLLRPTASGPSRAPRSSPRRPSGRSRSATTRGSSRRTSSPSSPSSRTGAPQGWADGEREIMPGVTVVPTGGHSTGHQAIVVRGAGDGAPDARVLRRPAACGRGRPTRAGSRRSTTSRSTRSCARRSSSPRPPTRTGSSSCRTRRQHPVGRLVRDRDRFRYEPI